jgi:YggT family protein
MLSIIQAILSFFISVSFSLIIYIVIFQFLLEVVGTGHHHPIRQYLLRYTQPLLDPIHRIIPNYREVDFALLAVLFLLENLKLILLFTLAWQVPNLLLMMLWSIFLIFNSFLDFFFFAILFRVLISWILPIYSNHPSTQIIYILTEPLLKPIRKRLPVRKGFDWTPIIVMIGLKVISMITTYSLVLLGAPRMIL